MYFVYYIIYTGSLLSHRLRSLSVKKQDWHWCEPKSILPTYATRLFTLNLELTKSSTVASDS